MRFADDVGEGLLDSCLQCSCQSQQSDACARQDECWNLSYKAGQHKSERLTTVPPLRSRCLHGAGSDSGTWSTCACTPAMSCFWLPTKLCWDAPLIVSDRVCFVQRVMLCIEKLRLAGIGSLPNMSFSFDLYPLKGPGCRRVTSIRSLLCVCKLGSMKVSCSQHRALFAQGCRRMLCNGEPDAWAQCLPPLHVVQSFTVSLDAPLRDRTKAHMPSQ